jgi:hypothetical protein
MADSTHPEVEQAESMLRPLMPGRFNATYIPDMSRRDGTRFRWFQVVFAVGPADTSPLRTQVHELFPRMLATLARVRLATDADFISLRARRFCPDTKILDQAHPVMFVEADWAASAFRAMREASDFSTWASQCATYRNHFDRDDPLTRQYSGEAVE